MLWNLWWLLGIHTHCRQGSAPKNGLEARRWRRIEGTWLRAHKPHPISCEQQNGSQKWKVYKHVCVNTVHCGAGHTSIRFEFKWDDISNVGFPEVMDETTCGKYWINLNAVWGMTICKLVVIELSSTSSSATSTNSFSPGYLEMPTIRSSLAISPCKGVLSKKHQSKQPRNMIDLPTKKSTLNSKQLEQAFSPSPEVYGLR